MQIDRNLYNEINEYCKLNGLKTREFIHRLLKDSFNKEKFGDAPFTFNKNAERYDEKEQITREEVINDFITVKSDIVHEKDVPSHINNIANNFKRTPIIDPLTGQLDLKKNFFDGELSNQIMNDNHDNKVVCENGEITENYCKHIDNDYYKRSEKESDNKEVKPKKKRTLK